MNARIPVFDTALETRYVAGRGAADGGPVLVLLAGAYDRPADFVAAGFVEALHASGRALDLVLVTSDLAAVCDGSLAARVHTDLVHPLRAAGRRVLTGGISIGALTALMHADLHPGASAGLVLLAPYPGNRTVTREIAAHGLAHWPAAADYALNDERRGWRALQALAATGAPPLWLGYGEDDRFAPGHALMATALPAEAQCRVPGGHDWPTWLALWQRWLRTPGA